MRTLLAITLACAATLGSAAFPATAAEKAKPRISVNLTTRGFEKTMTVRLTDVRSGAPIRGATVRASAEMTRPHVMTFPDWPVRASAPGVYRARVDFLMPADWTMTIKVSGKNVVATTMEHRASTTGAASGQIPVPSELAPASEKGTELVWIVGVLVGMLGIVAALVAAALVYGRPGRPRSVPAASSRTRAPEPLAADMSRARPRA